MKNLMCNFRLSPKKAFTPFSIFILMAGLTLGVFYGCQKEINFNKIENNGKTASTYALSIEEVKFNVF